MYQTWLKIFLIVFLTLSCVPAQETDQGSCIKAADVEEKLEEGYTPVVVVALDRREKVEHRCLGVLTNVVDASEFDLVFPRVCLQYARQHLLAIEVPTATGPFNRLLFKSSNLEKIYRIQRAFPGGYPIPLIKELELADELFQLENLKGADLQEERGYLGSVACPTQKKAKLAKQMGSKATCYGHLTLVSLPVSLYMEKPDLQLLSDVLKAPASNLDKSVEWIKSLRRGGSLANEFALVQAARFYQNECVESSDSRFCPKSTAATLKEIFEGADIFSDHELFKELPHLFKKQQLRKKVEDYYAEQSLIWTEIAKSDVFSLDEMNGVSISLSVPEDSKIIEKKLVQKRLEPMEAIFREYGLLNLAGTRYGPASTKEFLWSLAGIPLFANLEYKPTNFMVDLIKEPKSYFEKKIVPEEQTSSDAVKVAATEEDELITLNSSPDDFSQYQSNQQSSSTNSNSVSDLPKQKENPCK